MKDRDELCGDLLESTQRLLRAVERNDPEAIRDAIAQRQPILDRMAEESTRQPTEEQRAVLARVMETDARARREMAVLL